VTVEGAGRTDAGVHARGQVIAFTYSGRIGRRELQGALAASLPADIGLGPIVPVEPGFHPRHRARHREYRYLIWNGPRSPLRERQALGVRGTLDVAAMAAAARVFVGRRFSALTDSDRQPVPLSRRASSGKTGDRDGDRRRLPCAAWCGASSPRCCGWARPASAGRRAHSRESEPAFQWAAAPHG
jgi:tRNA pseudouridine38-40 synthase